VNYLSVENISKSFGERSVKEKTRTRFLAIILVLNILK
jgi:hypothetical protein